MSADPDVAAAIPELVRSGLLSPERAAPLLREARGERFSVRTELRAVLWLGVTLVTAGAGLLVRQEYERIGPLAIALALAAASALALVWAWRRAQPFSWGESAAPDLALDYLLLLGALLAAADLAWIEMQFTPLGANWPWHLLVVAVGYAVLAVRFDSRLLFSLALSCFAAWRGVSASGVALQQVLEPGEASARWNAIGCGLIFIALGVTLRRADRKAHFEPVAMHFGVGLTLIALWQGALKRWDLAWPWAGALLVAGLLTTWVFRRARRFWLFAFGVAAAYLALARFAVTLVDDPIGLFFWFIVSSLATLLWLWREQRRMQDDDAA